MCYVIARSHEKLTSLDLTRLAGTWPLGGLGNLVGFAKAAQGPVWAMGCRHQVAHGQSPLHHFVAVLLRMYSF